MHRIAAAVAAAAASMPAWATVVNPIPEPGMLELLVAAAVAGAIVWVRNRRK